MPMPVAALGGSALYAMERPRTKSASKTSFWLMAMLCLQMVLMVQNGYFAQPAKSLSTLNVSLHKQNSRLIPKDGPLPAHLISVKGNKIKWVNPPSNETNGTRSTKRVTIFGLYFDRNMVKQKFSTKGKEGKTL